jgi:hypothetical protein
MKRSLMCSTAAAAVALAASSVRADLVYSFETLYDINNVVDPAGTRPDDFAKNGSGTTISQSTVGVTQGSYSMEFAQTPTAFFTGALTEVIPSIINSPSTTALSVDVTVPATGNFTGAFSRLGISEFGLPNDQTDYGNAVLQAQTVPLTGESNIDLAPGTYHFTIPLIAIGNPITGTSPDFPIFLERANNS